MRPERAMSMPYRLPHPLHIHMAMLAPDFMDARTHLPLREIGEVPGVTTSFSDRQVVFPKLPADQPKLLLTQRGRVANPQFWIEGIVKLVRQGWIVVAEYDDHPDLVGTISAQKSSESRWMAIQTAHAVQTSTQILAGAFRPYNPEVAVFPNAAFEVVPAVPPPRRDGKLRVFFGAFNRERFSARVGAVLAPFAEAHPEVEFVVLRDRAFFDALGGANKTFSVALPYADYLRTLATCDVALMPLEGTQAEIYKSDIKFIEASAVGVASLVSPAVYAGSVEDGRTALVVHELEAWASALARLHREPALARRLARGARSYVVRERMFAQQIANRLDWYCGLWDRRHALTAGLAARLNGL